MNGELYTYRSSFNPVIKNIVKFSAFLNLIFIKIIFYTKFQKNKTMGCSRKNKQCKHWDKNKICYPTYFFDYRNLC
jgi:hypothetical protein